MRWSSTVRPMVRQAHHAAHDEACVDDSRDHVGFVVSLAERWSPGTECPISATSVATTNSAPTEKRRGA